MTSLRRRRSQGEEELEQSAAEAMDPAYLTSGDEEDDDDNDITQQQQGAADGVSGGSGGISSDSERMLRQRRRGRSSSRPSYKIPSKTRLRTRSDGTDQIQLIDRRDMSPSEFVRHFLSDKLARADEQIDHVIERIVHNVQEQAALKSQVIVNASSRMAQKVVDQADVIAEKSTAMVHNAVQKFRDWKACHFEVLPNWMKDNEHLHFGHRPELQSAAECFKSIFRIHTETGNIWTHMIGFFAFLVVTIVFYVKPFCDNCRQDIGQSEKLIFLCFFIGAMVCLLCSTLFHTMSCHSEWVSNVFSRLDYVGIAVLIVGSSLTWLYYGFYCEFYTKLTYMVAVSVLGVLTAIITMWEKFNMPDYRPYRAVLFVSLGVVSGLPVIHFVALHGVRLSVTYGALHHMLTMGGLYILGAALYALRIPERFLPGKCDIWFQSHQLFHLLVVIAAFVHYHGVYEMAKLRLQQGPACPVPTSTF